MLGKPVTIKIGGWVQMDYDAKMRVNGIEWIRVKDGLSGKGDREDWIANIPSGCVSIHDYQYREPRWGFEQYRSMKAAMIGQLRVYIDSTVDRIRDLTERIELAKVSIKIAKAAVSKKK